MIMRILRSDFIKIRRKAIWFLIFLGPFGVIALQAVNFGLRYDYLIKSFADDLWGGLLGQIHTLVPMTLMLGITIIASMVANVEHHMNGWKQLLALPIFRSSAFIAKFLLCLMLLFGSCILLAIGSIGLGIALQFGTDFPLVDIVKMSFYPMIAATPVLALQLWLSVVMKNQALPLTVGIACAIFSSFALKLPDWFMWRWPYLYNDVRKPEYYLALGVVFGIVMLVFGLIHFARRDVN